MQLNLTSSKSHAKPRFMKGKYGHPLRNLGVSRAVATFTVCGLHINSTYCRHGVGLTPGANTQCHAPRSSLSLNICALWQLLANSPNNIWSSWTDAKNILLRIMWQAGVLAISCGLFFTIRSSIELGSTPRVTGESLILESHTSRLAFSVPSHGL